MPDEGVFVGWIKPRGSRRWAEACRGPGERAVRVRMLELLGWQSAEATCLPEGKRPEKGRAK